MKSFIGDSPIVKRSPLWAYVICCLLLGLAFASFIVSLDRYPAFFVDEPFFNLSAARHIDGKPFVWIASTQAPHKDSVWAFHGPFFFRLQVLTFKLLGVSHFSCRFPEYFAGHLAVFFLCLFLLRSGLYKTAIGLAVLWPGDHSAMQILLGRPDGLALFFVVLGYICLVQAIRSKSFRFLAGASFFLGAASGFSPGAAYFGVAACISVALFLPPRDWGRALFAMAAGILAPFALVLLCWSPNVVASGEQLYWFLGFARKFTLYEKISHFQTLGWGIYWVIGLIISVVLVLFPISLKRIFQQRREGGAYSYPESIAIAAFLFSLAAIFIYLKSTLFKYYFVFFTVWPLISLGVFWEGTALGKKYSRLLFVAGVAIVLCWLPSLYWNITRFREAAVFYRILDKKPMVKQLSLYIPQKVKVMGDPVYFIVARDAHLSYEPLPFFSDPGIFVPQDAWLLVSSRYINILNSVNPSYLSNRPFVFQGIAFEGSNYMRQAYSIYGPAFQDIDKAAKGHI